MIIAIWAYLDNNIGDDLMIKLLANRFSEYDFYLYSNKSVVKNAFKEFSNIVIRDTEDIKKDRENFSVFLSIGGSIFNNLNSKWGIISRLRRIVFLFKLKRAGIKIATLGCNLGPYNNWVGPLLTKIELKLNNLVTVRDNPSYQMISDFKSVKNFFLSDDIVYNLKVNSIEKKEIGLGISAYRSLKDRDNNLVNYEVLARIIDEFIVKTSKNVRIFAFDTENENDLSAAHHIYKLCNKKEQIEIIAYLGDDTEFLSLFSECERMIAIRFHSAILSDIYKIPFLPIIYSNKMNSWLEDNNYSGEYLYIDNFTPTNIDILSLVDEIIDGNKLFYRDHELNTNSIIHFDKFEELLIK